MRLRVWTAAVAGFFAIAGAAACSRSLPTSLLKEGDILFQTSQSRQSEAVQLATHSRWSHMGMLIRDHGELKVLEAVQPVKLTPIPVWVSRGKHDEVVVKRLKDADKTLSPAVLDRMRGVGRGFLGRNYDLAFEWDDHRLYCSELVWKVYDRGAGIDLAEPRHLRDFDLSAPQVRQIMKHRYGDHPPLDEPAISPQDLFDSSRLLEVWPAKEVR